MKTTMASAAVLVVLALALVSAPLTAEAKKKRAGGESDPMAAEMKQADSFCATYCVGTKGMEGIVCKEGCELSQRANLVLYSRIQCKGKCTEQKGITAPQMKVCEAKCDKDYVGKAAEVIAACNKCCAREKNKQKAEKCRKGCTPPAS